MNTETTTFERRKLTNLTVDLVLVTPEVAKNYLRYNTRNRVPSDKNISFLSKQMEKGDFIENGESIVFDVNGELKDGQHRLLSIIKSGKSYFIPVVRGVQPISMATYDTGKNRSAADVLTLNNYKNTTLVASLIVGINNFSVKKAKRKNYTANDGKESKLTNTEVLEYCQENYDWLSVYAKKCITASSHQKPRVLAPTQIGIIAYLIGGENPSHEVWNFIDHLTGKNKIPATGACYVFTKLLNAKLNKDSLSFYWILGVSLKAWNMYIDGNPSVNYLRFSVEDELPKVKY
jgi:hypothetical protein